MIKDLLEKINNFLKGEDGIDDLVVRGAIPYLHSVVSVMLKPILDEAMSAIDRAKSYVDNTELKTDDALFYESIDLLEELCNQVLKKIKQIRVTK